MNVNNIHPLAVRSYITACGMFNFGFTSTSHFQLFGLLKHETDSPAISFRNSRTVNMVLGEVYNRRGAERERESRKQ
jgi:hypothetical protein